MRGPWETTVECGGLRKQAVSSEVAVDLLFIFRKKGLVKMRGSTENHTAFLQSTAVYVQQLLLLPFLFHVLLVWPERTRRSLI